MRVLIVNQHSSNFGDDAAGCALVQMLLTSPNVDEIDIIYNANKTIPIVNKKVNHHLDVKLSTAGYVNVAMYLLFNLLKIKPRVSGLVMKKWAKIIETADIVFVAPSGANIGIYKDWRFLIRLIMVVSAGKQVVFHYNTIGSSNNYFFDLLAKYVLNHSKIYVRERASQNYLSSLGLQSEFGPDTAFALERRSHQVNENIISIVPSSFDHWHPLFKTNPIDEKVQTILIPQIAKWANDKGATIQILPHLMSPDEVCYNRKIAECLRREQCDSVVIRDDIKNMWDYDVAIAESRIVIGMRYHAIVLAAKNNRPFLALAYENKMNEVCSYTHMDSYLVDLNELKHADTCSIVHLLHMIEEDEDYIENKMKDVLKADIIPLLMKPINTCINSQNH